MAAAYLPATNVATFAATGDALTMEMKRRTQLVVWDSFTAAADTFSLTDTDSGQIILQAQAGATSGSWVFNLKTWVKNVTLTCSAGRCMIAFDDGA
jgi:hypothetical protein